MPAFQISTLTGKPFLMLMSAGIVLVPFSRASIFLMLLAGLWPVLRGTIGGFGLLLGKPVTGQGLLYWIGAWLLRVLMSLAILSTIAAVTAWMDCSFPWSYAGDAASMMCGLGSGIVLSMAMAWCLCSGILFVAIALWKAMRQSAET